MSVATFLASCASAPLPAVAPQAPCQEPVVAQAAPVNTTPEALPDTTLLDALSATRSFRLGRPEKITITPDGKIALFLRAKPRDPTRELFAFDLESGVESTIVTASSLLAGAEEHLTAEEHARRERMRQIARGIADFKLAPDGHTILIPLSGKIFLFDLANNHSRALALPEGAPVDPRFSPDGKNLAYTRNGDLFIFDLAANSERRITHRANSDVSYGEAEFVAQEEMDRMEGYWWSPDSKQLLVEEANTAGMEIFHIADPAHPESDPITSAYPRVGKANAKVKLFLVGIRGGRMAEVRWDHAAFEYLAKVVWEKGSNPAILVQNRKQTDELLLSVDPRTGTSRELLREHDDAFLNIDPELPRFLENGKFLWTTERHGAWQVELRNADGSFAENITMPELGYRALVHVDLALKNVVVQASTDPTQTQLYRVSLDGTNREATALTTEVGAHEGYFADNVSTWIEDINAFDGTRAVRVRKADGSIGHELKSVAEAPPYLPNVTLETVTIGENRELHAAVIRPQNFDATKHYAVLDSVYGGPHYNSVTATRYRYFLQQWFADQGFIVVAIDGRGTQNRGRDWERAISHDVISTPLADQAAGVRALAAKHPEMDAERAGIFGWSFGGYFSLHAVLREPGLFRAAVAGAPVTDWLDYDTHYTERYMGLPDENAAGYASTSALTWASHLERPLLIVHGTADDNVYFLHSARMTEALVRAGREFEFLPLSGQTHMVADPALSRRADERMLTFFLRHLGHPR